MILVLLIIAVAELYFWLIGNWFGRVVAFLTLGSVLVVFAWAATFKDPSVMPVLAISAAGCAAWFLAGIPQYYINHKQRAARLDAPLRLYL